MATNSPRSTARSTPRSACTSMSPTTKVRVRFLTSITRSCMRLLGGGSWPRPLRLLAGDDFVAFLEIALEDLGKTISSSPVVTTTTRGRASRMTKASRRPRGVDPLESAFALLRIAQRSVGRAQGLVARSSTTMRVVAVMPGFSDKSLLGAATTTS